LSIYESIGGAGSVAAAVELFYGRVLQDDVLAPYFEGRDVVRLKGHMRSFLAAAIGGAEIYAGRDMGVAHAGLGITDEAFDHVVGHLVDTLTELNVPAETIGEIGAKLTPLRASIVQPIAA
jgi:hemoglobin